MNFKIAENYNLTTEHPASHYNIPVVVDLEDRAYGPASLFPYPKKFKAIFGKRTFDQFVWSWATEEERTEEEVKAASLFLGQWPEGLQIEL